MPNYWPNNLITGNRDTKYITVVCNQWWWQYVPLSKKHERMWLECIVCWCVRKCVRWENVIICVTYYYLMWLYIFDAVYLSRPQSALSFVTISFIFSFFLCPALYASSSFFPSVSFATNYLCFWSGPSLGNFCISLLKSLLTLFMYYICTYCTHVQKSICSSSCGFGCVCL